MVGASLLDEPTLSQQIDWLETKFHIKFPAMALRLRNRAHGMGLGCPRPKVNTQGTQGPKGRRVGKFDQY